MNVRGKLAGLVLVVSVLAVVASPTATSAPGVNCTFSGDLILEPGLSAVPSSGSFDTARDRSGTYRCRGPFGPSRSGTARTTGEYGTADPDTCEEGGGGHGTLHRGNGGSDGDGRNDFSFTYSPFSEDGVATGTFSSEHFNGTLKLKARNGDCALIPVTRISLEGRGTISP